MGVEPTTSAWEANVLPINYIRITQLLYHRFSDLSIEKSAKTGERQNSGDHFKKFQKNGANFKKPLDISE